MNKWKTNYGNLNKIDKLISKKTLKNPMKKRFLERIDS